IVFKFNLQPALEFLFLKDLKFSADKSFEDLLVTSFKKNKGKEMSHFLSLPGKKIKDLTSFHDSYEKILNTPKDKLIQFASPLDEKSDLEFFKDLKNLEDKKEWRNYFQGSLPVSWSDWEGVMVSESELNLSPPQIRSFIRYHKALLKVIGNA
ncbi:MAG: hypothetical protein K2Q18_07560, partial [Bdellovibrionales bacterium]|nr:hypothetical protein [Bdellovibrionales bacterium]